MARVYSIVKKNTIAHRKGIAGVNKKNVFRVNATHFMVPSIRNVSTGNLVSHAKNRTPHRRLPNLKVLQVLVDGIKKAVRLSAHDLRTYKKLTTPAQAE